MTQEIAPAETLSGAPAQGWRRWMMVRLALGGALGGWFLGTFGGALCGAICGAVRGDVSLGLDVAIWGGLVTAAAGTLYGCALGPDRP